jgi:hypothetical protein
VGYSVTDLGDHVLLRLAQVRLDLGLEPPPADAGNMLIADLLDSMGLVEYLAILAEDCGVEPAAIEQAVQRRFGTVAELAQAMVTAGIRPQPTAGERQNFACLPGVVGQPDTSHHGSPETKHDCWLAATAICLPDAVQTAAAINQLLQRPAAGWNGMRASGAAVFGTVRTR